MLHAHLESAISLGLTYTYVKGLIINVTHTDVKALLFFRRSPTYFKALIIFFISVSVRFSSYVK